MKQRADILLVEQGHAASRSEAQALLIGGKVFWQERRIDKAGQLLPAEARLAVRAGRRFVSRGGDKLDGALRTLGFDVSGMTVLDIGASTGGFTDCALQRGARRVVAIDVGHGQLAERLRRDPRVTNLEGVNARHLTRELLRLPVDLILVDASFISLTKLLPAIAALIDPNNHLLALVKPQFEAGRREAQRSRGVIRDAGVRTAAIARVCEEVEHAGFELLGRCDSALPGPKGNVECFVLARRLGG